MSSQRGWGWGWGASLGEVPSKSRCRLSAGQRQLILLYKIVVKKQDATPDDDAFDSLVNASVLIATTTVFCDQMAIKKPLNA